MGEDDGTVKCGMPVFRKEYDEESDEYSIVVGVCGEPLTVDTEGSGTLYSDGQHDDGCGTLWKVGCYAGHVLLLPDHGGDDDYSQIPFPGPAALDAIARFIADASAHIEKE